MNGKKTAPQTEPSAESREEARRRMDQEALWNASMFWGIATAPIAACFAPLFSLCGLDTCD